MTRIRPTIGRWSSPWALAALVLTQKKVLLANSYGDGQELKESSWMSTVRARRTRPSKYARAKSLSSQQRAVARLRKDYLAKCKPQARLQGRKGRPAMGTIQTILGDGALAVVQGSFTGGHTPPCRN